MKSDASTSRELINYYAPRLSRLKWKWLGTLMFRRRSVPSWMADRIFDQLILEIGGDDGNNYVSWFRMNENPGFETEPYFYVLVGGSWHGGRSLLMDRWHDLAGDSEITHVSSSEHVTKFITGKARLSDTFDIN